MKYFGRSALFTILFALGCWALVWLGFFIASHDLIQRRTIWKAVSVLFLRSALAFFRQVRPK